jgi:hypothetical protein
MHLALVAAVGTVIVFTTRIVLRACRLLVTALLQQLPPGSRIVIRCDHAELRLLVPWPQALPERSETKT